MNSIKDIKSLIDAFEVSPKNPKRNLALLYYKLSILYFRQRKRREGLKANEKGKAIFSEIIEDLRNGFESLEKEKLVNAIYSSITYSMYIDMDYVMHASNALLENHAQYLTPSIKADLYFKKGKVYSKRNEFKIAKEFLEKSICLFDNLQDNNSKMSVLEELSTIHFIQGDYHEAIDTQKEISSLISKEDINAIVTNHNLMGMNFLHLNDLHSALEQFNIANELVKSNTNLFRLEIRKNSQKNVDSTLLRIQNSQ